MNTKFLSYVQKGNKNDGVSTSVISSRELQMCYTARSSYLGFFNTFYNTLVQVVIMQLGSSPEKNKQYKKEIGINAPLLSATPAEMKNYKVKCMPTSVLIDKKTIKV